MAKRLSEIDLDEVSLVDTPAIKRRFLIIKKQEVDMDDEDLTLEDVETEEVKKKLSDKAVNAIKDASVEAMADAVKEHGYPEAKGEGEYAKTKKEETEKAGAKFSKEDKEKIRQIAKQILSLIEEEVTEATEVKKADEDEILSYVKTKVKELAK